MSNELWNLHCTHTTDEESDFDTVTEWAANYIIHLESQLATLKQSQGEPVAVAHVGNRTFYVTANPRQLEKLGFSREDSFDIPLYTSAPAIPEGWQLVPINPTNEMILAGEPVAYLVYSSTRHEQEFLYEDELGYEEGSEITPLYTAPTKCVVESTTIPEGWKLVETSVWNDAIEFVNRHSEPWYLSGQELLIRMKAPKPEDVK